LNTTAVTTVVGVDHAPHAGQRGQLRGQHGGETAQGVQLAGPEGRRGFIGCREDAQLERIEQRARRTGRRRGRGGRRERRQRIVGREVPGTAERRTEAHEARRGVVE